MTTKITQDNAEHYVWGDHCDGWHLLQRPDISVIKERVPPGCGEQRHFHSRATQFFFILEGLATIEIEDRAVSLGPQEGLAVLPGLPHRFHNSSDREVVFLVISAPSSHGDRQNTEV